MRDFTLRARAAEILSLRGELEARIAQIMERRVEIWKEDAKVSDELADLGHKSRALEAEYEALNAAMPEVPAIRVRFEAEPEVVATRKVILPDGEDRRKILSRGGRS